MRVFYFYHSKFLFFLLFRLFFFLLLILKLLDVILMTSLFCYLKFFSFFSFAFAWSAAANLVKLVHDLNFLDGKYVKNLRN